MAALDIIKFDGFSDGRAWVAYKYPGDQFLLGSQLIVNPGQEAVFLKGGEICDVFTSGTHTLQTGNLPILKDTVYRRDILRQQICKARYDVGNRNTIPA